MTGSSPLVDLCAIDDIPLDEGLAIPLADGHVVAAFRSAGDIFVVDDLCTHGEASLSEGYVEAGSVFCPFHGGAFCLATGQATAAPCYVPIRTYAVTILDGRVLVSAP